MTAAAPARDSLEAAVVTPLLRTRWLARNYHWLECTDSTNRVAMELAREGAPHGTTVVAEEQRAGRGRLGRSFYSPAYQNLYSSTVLRSPSEPARAATLVFAAAVAVAETVAEELGRSDIVEIKWPNDVLLDGLKTSGILTEAFALGAERIAILGIGVNLNVDRSEFPDEFREAATSLASFGGKPVHRAGFAARLYGKLEAELDRHARGGFAALRDAYERRFHMVGRQVRVKSMGGPERQRVIEGIVKGVSPDGALRIERDDGREEQVLAGDVTIEKGAPS